MTADICQMMLEDYQMLVQRAVTVIFAPMRLTLLLKVWQSVAPLRGKPANQGTVA